MTATEFSRPATQTMLVKGSLALSVRDNTAGVESVKASRRAGERRVVEGITHGTVTGYCSAGCRCPECTAAMSFRSKQLQVERARGGPLLVDGQPLMRVLEYAITAGLRWPEIAARAGVNEDYWRAVSTSGRKIHRYKRDRILKAVDGLLRERRDALDDLSSALDFARGRQPKRKTGQEAWPCAPLRDVIDRVYPIGDRKSGDFAKPPISDADRTYLYHSETVDTARADRVCVQLGIAPESVWGLAWFGVLEEVG